MTELSYRDVVDILKLIDDTPHCASLDLEIGGLKLSVRRQEPAASAAVLPTDAPAASAQPHAGGAAASTASTSGSSASTSGSAASTSGSAASTSSGSASTPGGAAPAVIRAPLLGTFYTSLEPGAAPCVSAGDEVGPDDVVGLIEVMKLFTQVKAGTHGRIRELLVANASLVEHGQPLFRIDPL